MTRFYRLPTAPHRREQSRRASVPRRLPWCFCLPRSHDATAALPGSWLMAIVQKRASQSQPCPHDGVGISPNALSDERQQRANAAHGSRVFTKSHQGTTPLFTDIKTKNLNLVHAGRGRTDQTPAERVPPPFPTPSPPPCAPPRARAYQGALMPIAGSLSSSQTGTCCRRPPRSSPTAECTLPATTAQQHSQSERHEGPIVSQ